MDDAVDDMDEIVAEFLVESHENLDQLDRDLVALEQEPGSRPLLASIFRTVHTIKGTSGFLGYSALESVTHVGENLLSRLRDGEMVLTPQIASVLLELVDAVRGLLGEIEATGGEGAPDHAGLLARLTALQDAGDGDTTPAPAAGPAPAADPVPDAVAEGAPPLGQVLVEAGAVTVEQVALAVMDQQLGEPRRLGEILVEHGSASGEDVADAVAAQAAGSRRSVADSSIRVDVDLLDSLMRLVGELVLTRNQIVQHASGQADLAVTRAAQRLNLIASELQEGVMKTRMQPIDHVWSKLTRVVRDLGVACGKQVLLEMEGRDTELDRTILEAVKDPLTHLVRNSVDHGIESPEQRIAAGKPAAGTLLLRAFHEGGQVNIDIVDDGAGIDPRRVGAKALERGLVTGEELARMSVRETVALVFQPGFSTAEAVTNVSGRGVGMDVVKTNIESIGGSVDVQSEVGVGTTFRIKIPLTLAIIPALTVRCAGDRYAIPQVSLVELVRLGGDEAGKGIEHLSGAPVLRLRGSLLPLVHLRDELGGLAHSGEGPADGEQDPATYIVVLQADGRQFGLVVDEVLDTEEIVVKPLGQQLKGLSVYAGATILGDGRVALILDSLALAHQAHVLRAARDRVGGDLAATAETTAKTEPLLVVGLVDGRRVAVPLETVTRLEEFPRTAVERVGSRQVVQYRGQILPLLDVSAQLGAFGLDDPSPTLQVVVYSERGRSVGLVVDCILDIADEALTARSDVEDHGLLGSVVVQDRITEILDVRQVLTAADPHFYDAEPVGGPAPWSGDRA